MNPYLTTLLCLFIVCTATAQEQRVEGPYLTMGPTGKTRIAGLYGTFDAGVTLRVRAGGTHYARFARPHLSGSMGKQMTPRVAMGFGGGLYDLVVMTAPLFGELIYVHAPADPGSFVARGRLGYSSPLDNFGAETSLSFPTSGRDSERGGLFLRTDIGIRFVTKGGADILPTLGYTYTSYTEISGRFEATQEFHRLTLGIGTKF